MRVYLDDGFEFWPWLMFIWNLPSKRKQLSFIKKIWGAIFGLTTRYAFKVECYTNVRVSEIGEHATKQAANKRGILENEFI